MKKVRGLSEEIESERVLTCEHGERRERERGRRGLSEEIDSERVLTCEHGERRG